MKFRVTLRPGGDSSHAVSLLCVLGMGGVDQQIGSSILPPLSWTSSLDSCGAHTPIPCPKPMNPVLAAQPWCPLCSGPGSPQTPCPYLCLEKQDSPISRHVFVRQGGRYFPNLVFSLKCVQHTLQLTPCGWRTGSHRPECSQGCGLA